MINEIKAVLLRAETTIVKDFIGGLALLIVLIGGLHLPGIA